MRAKPTFLLALLVAAWLLSFGVGADSSLATARAFSPHVTNAFFPLVPGSTLVYRGVKDGRAARDEFTVMRQTAVIGGARCAVVRDRLYLDGRLAERTTDWYTQDSAGNVWYNGEATAELDAHGGSRARKAPGRPTPTARSRASSCPPGHESGSRLGRSSTRATRRTTSR